MPQVTQIKLLDARTTDGTGSAFDVRDITAYSVYASAVGGTSASVQFEGTADPAGSGGFAALAVRQAGGGAYATTAVSITPAAPKSFYFDPSDNLTYIRAVVSSQSGPTAITATLSGEQ